MNRARELGAVIDADGVAKFKAYRQASRNPRWPSKACNSRRFLALPALTSLAAATATGLGHFQQLPSDQTTATAIGVLAPASAMRTEIDCSGQRPR